VSDVGSDRLQNTQGLWIYLLQVPLSLQMLLWKFKSWLTTYTYSGTSVIRHLSFPTSCGVINNTRTVKQCRMSEVTGCGILKVFQQRMLKKYFGTQGHLISILGPGQSSALRPLSMQTLTGINCKWSIKLNIYSGTCVIRHLSFPTFCDFRQEFQVPKYFFNILHV
jgi:hypothetical protein